MPKPLNFKKACDLNLADACYNLANLYRMGEGTRQDFTNARKYYEKACDADIADSCNNLGGLYAEGKGVKQNHSTAKKNTMARLVIWAFKWAVIIINGLMKWV